VTECQKLMESIAKTTADYRKGEIAAPTPEHVDRWVAQFEVSAQLPILAEVDHVLKCTYFSQREVECFIAHLIINKELAGTDPCAYWRSVNFLDIQKNGHSQRDMLSIFGKILKEKCGIAIGDCGSKCGEYIFLDDAIFSGSRVRSDLDPWIQTKAPAKATVHVVTIALYTGSEWTFRVPLAESIKNSKKNIVIKRWRAIELENQKVNKDTSEVFWPVEIPSYPDVQAYVKSQQKFAFVTRTPGSKTKHPIFSSEAGRQLLELHFLSAGVKIRGFCNNPKPILRPLGFGLFGLGFGSTIVTFRNCPNNAPLAMWWGDPDAVGDHPFSKWYPLFPRKTYLQEFGFDAIDQ